MGPDIVEIALSRITDSNDFEKLATEIMQNEGYPNVRQLGGVSDKGRDGVQENLFESNVRTRIVFQYTIQKENVSSKVKSTIRKLEENKIEYSDLVYVTNHKINTKYGVKRFLNTNCELHIYSKDFIWELHEKGLPLGNKTRKKFCIPEWIKKSNKLIKRLFLAGFFGAEMSSPNNISKTCFYCPTIDQNKIKILKQNCRDFLIDVALLLKEFGVKDYTISEMDDFKNKYNEKKKEQFRQIYKPEF